MWNISKLWFKNNHQNKFTYYRFSWCKFQLEKNDEYYPLRKPSNHPLYINALSNNSKSIIKKVPNTTGKRISVVSCDKHENLRMRIGIRSKLSKRVVSVKKLSTKNKVLVNVMYKRIYMAYPTIQYPCQNKCR